MNKKPFSTVQVVIFLLALVVVVGGYFAFGMKTQAPVTQTPALQTPTSTVAGVDATGGNSQSVSVSGMKQYTDSGFGFSFWYPNTWTVQNATIKNNYTGGTIQKTLIIAPPSDPNGTGGETITIDEFSSPTREITIARDLCSPMSGSSVPAHRYYFDVNAHTWMVEVPAYTGSSEKDGSQYSVPASTKAADVSSNTMGGLHMLGAGCSGSVIPLSAQSFVVFLFNSRNVGPSYSNVAKTITATDPSVATPVNITEQIKTITTEGIMLGGLGTPIGGGLSSGWISYNGTIYDGNGVLIPNVDVNSFIPVLANGKPSGFAKDVKNVYVAGKGILEGADPRTFQIIIGPNGQGTYFEKDKNYVWNIETIVAGADPNTFSIILNPKNPTDDFSFFQKDATHVWDRGVVIPNADPATFHILNQAVSQSALFEADATHVWYDNLLIPGADPKTFMVDAYNTSDWTALMHDASHSYQLLNTLNNISTTTVKIDGGTPIPLQ